MIHWGSLPRVDLAAWRCANTARLVSALYLTVAVKIAHNKVSSRYVDSHWHTQGTLRILKGPHKVFNILKLAFIEHWSAHNQAHTQAWILTHGMPSEALMRKDPWVSEKHIGTVLEPVSILELCAYFCARILCILGESGIWDGLESVPLPTPWGCGMPCLHGTHQMVFFLWQLHSSQTRPDGQEEPNWSKVCVWQHT